MDAKSRANFINSVAAGNSVSCPKCGTANEQDSKYCISCGAELSEPQTTQTNTPVFEQIKEQEAPVQTSQYAEPNNVFAKGLPDWSIEPPQVMVRRH